MSSLLVPMKHSYIIEHFVPYPQSESGGVWFVIAEDNEECYDLIVGEDGDFNTEHYSDLRSKIMNAVSYPLAGEPQSKVVLSFLT